MNCPTCQSTDVRPGVNGLHVCHGCGTVIGNYFPTAPVNYGKRYHQIKFTAPPPVAPEFYEQLSKEADDAINAEVQRRQEQTFVWAFGGEVTANPTVPPNMMYAIGASPSVARTHVYAHCNRCGVNRLVERGAGLPECECAPTSPLYDGLTTEECLKCYTAWLHGAANEGRGHKLAEWMPACQLAAARDLWAAQLRARVAATSKPKLTVMVQVDDD